MKLEDVTREVVEKIVALCPDCGFSDTFIDKQSFSCYPNSPSFVTYRARIEGTSKTDSDQFISLIEEWVMGGASVIVSGVLMQVDSKCLIEISDLSEAECIMKLIIGLSPTAVLIPEQNFSGKENISSLTIALTVIGIFITVFCITGTAVAVVVLRIRRAKYNFKSVAKMYVTSYCIIHQI